MNGQMLWSGLDRLLAARRWMRQEEFGAFQPYSPPPQAGLAEEFRLLIPLRIEESGAFDHVLRSLTLLSEVYGYDRDDLIVALSENATVFATRIRDDAAAGGTLPLDRFESLVDRLKKVCLTAASSVLSEDPLAEDDPEDAQSFVARCSFLQTRLGSFESRIALPNDFPLGRRLDNQEGVPAAEATERIERALRVVFEDVIPRKEYIYSGDFVEDLSHTVHVPLMRNVALMLRDTEFREYEFRFVGLEEEVRLSPPRLSKNDIGNVYRYVRYLQEKLASETPVDLLGKVTELRSQDIRSSNNFVRVRGYDQRERREMELSLSMGRHGYMDAITAHGKGQTVHVVGTVRKLKSYYRVDDLVLFELV